MIKEYIGKNFRDADISEKEMYSMFSDNFVNAWQKTMRWEGGGHLHNVSGDTGGLTKWGISQQAYPDLDIANLSKKKAMQIAYDDYWVLMHCNKIASISGKTAATTAGHVFDIGFNMGHKWGIKMLQRAINKVHGAKILKDDGIFGNKTLAALIRTDSDKMPQALRDVRVKRFKWLALRRPLNQKFLRGWTNRANDFA
jgi:lysozyme family protein